MKVSIIGAGGLTGRELIGLLANHPDIEIVHVTSNKTAGKKISEIFPNLRFKKDLVFKTHEEEIPKESLVVLAVPNEVSLAMTPNLLEKGHKVIDLSGAYRLHNKDLFEKFYNLKHDSFHLMEKVVFGIPEMFRDKLKGADFVSNPGCYATSGLLPLFMLGSFREKISGPIVIDSKSGVSGAGGRTEDIGFTFTNTYENFRAYKILSHQHTPEIEEYAGYKLSSKLPKIVFTPHLLPVYRGILSTFVISFQEAIDPSQLANQFSKFQSEPFIRLYKKPEEVELKNIQNSNFLDFSYKLEENILVIVSALDNLVKGAAGQALQNINLMLGLEETKGLLA
ncbi:MAG TPA: N-acetyl-gamma-glutamyl-phosphate reductase [Leptospiraceae bacterium]|nr:N-acetyl-gamma-glutamyl-phosphate reductase [Leptospiraceae bacterium]HMW07519.1 N-acetyl-gamma-glutamyl-phosphate reductase [Leptospiraceae bacterium]HMX33303.1 N-acetyl-gamma-glutamyl-phosphate reductase [Leptospiraceae bacterium]HMY33180.1 N-acetyl-gamma-glutamyl-phosphate reductase [Leptospiraceae bacterium]HMZ67230.1 N-acetyl-gamma-glutamyl-phosphate reductase [Leptospiraceae bacterium]